MKCFVLVVAVVALASAIEEKKPLKEEEKKPVVERGLVWPLPDPVSEGDLMLHGSISYDRVRALHKGKVEDDVDKMILAHGRLFLRRVSKFFDDNANFKIMPILCRDTRNLNATENRWEIEIPKPQATPVAENREIVQQDQPIPKDANAEDAPRRNATDNETITTTNATVGLSSSSAAPSSSSSIAPSSSSSVASSSSIAPSTSFSSSSSVAPSSSASSASSSSSAAPSSSVQPSDKPVLATTLKPIESNKSEENTYEIRRSDFYRQVGANFARLLMKEYRKEPLIAEETEFLAHWIADGAVHYGAVAIYCNEGENVKEIKKQLAIFLEEKP